jgi:hypothetical protein
MLLKGLPNNGDANLPFRATRTIDLHRTSKQLYRQLANPETAAGHREHNEYDLEMLRF